MNLAQAKKLMNADPGDLDARRRYADFLEDGGNDNAVSIQRAIADFVARIQQVWDAYEIRSEEVCRRNYGEGWTRSWRATFEVVDRKTWAHIYKVERFIGEIETDPSTGQPYPRQEERRTSYCWVNLTTGKVRRGGWKQPDPLDRFDVRDRSRWNEIGEFGLRYYA